MTDPDAGRAGEDGPDGGRGDECTEAQEEERERFSLLAQVEDWLERPMWLLAFAWLVLLVLELARGTTPLLSRVGMVIWALFVLEFLIKLAIAPRKLAFVGRNWITALSLLVPALRLLRFGRVLVLARAARGARLVRVFGSINRGLRALGASMSRRGLKYVLASTLVVLLAGATGMYAFERPGQGEGDAGALPDFGTALWWTAMVLTTMGSEAWPRTAEGRLLCLFLAVYAFAVFGYVTAALATYFVGRDAERPDAELAGRAEIEALRREIAALRAELRARGPERPTSDSQGPPGPE